MDAFTPIKPPMDFGRFRLLREIGYGGMATVYLAEKIGMEGFRKRVAIKILSREHPEKDDFVKLFISEARLGGFLSHPNIVETRDFGREGGRLFLAMEYVDGPTLNHLLYCHREAKLPIPLQISLQILVQVCEGLSYAHQARDNEDRLLHMIHRDLKPSNILLSKHGLAKIADFGVARATSNVEHTKQSGMIKGTVRYLSPEQAWGQKEMDHRSDIFAVGIILFETLTLEHLYHGDNPQQILRAAQDVEIEPSLDQIPDLPHRDRFMYILRKALGAAPWERFDSAGEMAKAMDQLLARFPRYPRLVDWLGSSAFCSSGAPQAGLVNLAPSGKALSRVPSTAGEGDVHAVSSERLPTGAIEYLPPEDQTDLVLPEPGPDLESLWYPSSQDEDSDASSFSPGTGQPDGGLGGAGEGGPAAGAATSDPAPGASEAGDAAPGSPLSQAFGDTLEAEAEGAPAMTGEGGGGQPSGPSRMPGTRNPVEPREAEPDDPREIQWPGTSGGVQGVSDRTRSGTGARAAKPDKRAEAPAGAERGEGGGPSSERRGTRRRPKPVHLGGSRTFRGQARSEGNTTKPPERADIRPTEGPAVSAPFSRPSNGFARPSGAGLGLRASREDEAAHSVFDLPRDRPRVPWVPGRLSAVEADGVRAMGDNHPDEGTGGGDEGRRSEGAREGDAAGVFDGGRRSGGGDRASDDRMTRLWSAVEAGLAGKPAALSRNDRTIFEIAVTRERRTSEARDWTFSSSRTRRAESVLEERADGSGRSASGAGVSDTDAQWPLDLSLAPTRAARVTASDEGYWAARTDQAADGVDEHFERGMAYCRRGEYQQAIEAWEEALAIDPENRWVKSRLRRLKKQLESDASGRS